MTIFFVHLLVIGSLRVAAGLSCLPCGRLPCQVPACCPSGRYTLDPCGCCLTCAKAEGETCGGPWETAGTCARGLHCKRDCHRHSTGCKTLQLGEHHHRHEDKCIFPFIHNGKRYTACTTDCETCTQTQGKAWCATQVNHAGAMIQWGFCREHCPLLHNSACQTTPHDGEVDVNHQHCVFPFRYQGKIYSECTTDCTRCTETLRRPWCATRLDRTRNAVDWALCQPGCPGVSLHGLSWAVGEDGLPTLVFGVPDLECKSIEHDHHDDQHNQDCIFPFVYQGKRYTECTNDCTRCSETHGRPWCATQVDGRGAAVEWGLCEPGCPGTDFACDESELFNSEGICVKNLTPFLARAAAEPFPDIGSGPGAADQPVAPECHGGGARCVCGEAEPGRDGEMQGGCLPPSPFVEPWCFLKNVADPLQPSQHCFQDIQWSPADGRFWSTEACKAKQGDLLLLAA